MKTEKYSGLRGNQNRAGKTKPESEKLSSSITIPMTSEEKGLLKAAAYPQTMTEVYRPVLLKEAERLKKN